MSLTDDPDITALLARWRSGDPAAGDALMQTVYPVMRALAQARLQRSAGELTLSATEIANEAYTRLVRIEHIDYRDRSHFLAVAARAMRNIVVDHLRARGRDKGGGNLPFVALDQIDIDAEGAHELIDLRVDWLAVHDALNQFEQVDQACARIVELKFFSGLTTDEIAEACNISSATVVRNWRFAKAWLTDRLQTRR
ncbi:RNA polymerase sigma factor (TIGR02999 family) [Tahibacter aquaticus]|uniref:RNA polymerase sigma factor (TIGR02999 family) n=1 Tax=Tahibacter aquaticus TaxID=520092 RepID=A0A4R6YW68_9GAMM|nr:ECF-type sigma factor [Tahibacter aquaticus]TDR43064.1 RNA polymerase sigma factor (TIGR02999 family) [Tahibacter aquaticus]